MGSLGTLADDDVPRRGPQRHELSSRFRSRLTGSVTAVVNGDERIVTGSNFRVDLQSGALRIENDGGGWTGSLTSINHFRSGGEPTTAIYTAVLSGEGAYDGLTAYLLADFTETPPVVQGAVFAGEMTPAPDPVPAE